MKVQINSGTTLSPFAGISFFDNCFNTSGLKQLIDNELGSRVLTVGYSYSDIIKDYWSIFLTGGDNAEDIQTHVGKYLKSIPGNATPRADTLLRGLKELYYERDKFPHL
jgi:hypothetical protein